MMYSANLLREKVELLELVETAEGWEWQKAGETWAGVELTGKSCLFSKLGIGARAAGVTIRRRELTLHQAMRWRGMHLFLSEITEPERGWLDVAAAVVEVTRCRARAPEPGPEFPAALTEKYVGHAQGMPMDTLTTTYVLVTPKCIGLTIGGLVEVGIAGETPGEAYQVTAHHVLDPWKNEYEVKRKRDL